MITVDDRQTSEKRTHNVLIVAIDTFMTGWGECPHGLSRAVWACTPEHADTIEAWVRSRSDTRRVRRAGPDYRATGDGHTHIYVVTDNHPALIAENIRANA